MPEIKTEPIELYGLSQKERSKNEFSKIGIIGGGVVGREISLLVSKSGIDVVIVEVSEERIIHAFRELEISLNKQIDHWGMTSGEKKLILSRIKASLKYSDLTGCDLVIECIKSKSNDQMLDLRRSIFMRVEEYVSNDCIIATNSTAAIITELSSVLKFSDRSIGIHFLTTNPNARIVELVRGLHTSSEIYENAVKFIKMINKTPVLVEESSGLISVRIVSTMINEACDVFMEGVSSLESIDLTMKNYFGLILGPFELADKIGLDKIQSWMDELYEEFGYMKYKTSPLIKRLARANHLGRKTLRGFYVYDENGNRLSKQAELHIIDI